MNKIRKVLVGTVLLVTLFLVTMGTAGTVLGFKYYGYYARLWLPAADEYDDVQDFSNVVILRYNEDWGPEVLRYYIQHRYNQGYKVILGLHMDFQKNHHPSTSVLRKYLDELGNVYTSQWSTNSKIIIGKNNIKFILHPAKRNGQELKNTTITREYSFGRDKMNLIENLESSDDIKKIGYKQKLENVQ